MNGKMSMTILLRAQETDGIKRGRMPVGSCRIRERGGVYRTEWTVRNLAKGEYRVFISGKDGGAGEIGRLQGTGKGSVRAVIDTKTFPLAAALTDEAGEALILFGAADGKGDRVFQTALKKRQAERPQTVPEKDLAEEARGEKAGREPDVKTAGSGVEKETAERGTCAAKRAVWTVEKEGVRGWLIERIEGEDEPPVGWDGAQPAGLFGKDGWLIEEGKVLPALISEKVRFFLPEN